MLEVMLMIGGWLLIALGFVGCVVPVLPGPLLAYAALWLLALCGIPPGTDRLLLGGGAVAVAMVVDYVLPTIFAQKFRCSKAGVVGCVVGTVAGLFFMPLGIVLGPFLGTVAGELVVGKSLGASLKGGLGALLGFVACLVVKFAAVAYSAYLFMAAFPK